MEKRKKAISEKICFTYNNNKTNKTNNKKNK